MFVTLFPGVHIFLFFMNNLLISNEHTWFPQIKQKVVETLVNCLNFLFFFLIIKIVNYKLATC
jgi:hypothetical protein